MSSLLDPNLAKTLKKDQQLLEQTGIPIITVSASYKEDLKQFYGLPADDITPDVVLSRAHYSMALGTAMAAWGTKIRPEKAWIVDPTNYVSSQEWGKIEFTELVGKTLARRPVLKLLKDFIDRFGRSKLPILSSITPPLLHLTSHLDRPILSFHIAAGNILAAHGRSVVQVVTDPHVRSDYLEQADSEQMHFCVFDEHTKTEFLEKATILGKEVNPNRVHVSGPPIDPRILRVRKEKKAWRSGPIKLAITTGGLGTNKEEIRLMLESLLPQLRKKGNQLRLMVYTSTHHDIFEMIRDMARQHRIKALTINSPAKGPSLASISKSDTASLIVLHHPQIVDANELLIKYAFPWADGFITKPSGDMAYDAAAAGCFLLTLAEWGEWEHAIREIFEQKGIARKADVHHILEQLTSLTDTYGKSQSWVEKAMINAQKIDKQFLTGSDEILAVVKEVSKGAISVPK